MRTQDEIGLQLRERLAVYATLATAITSNSVVEIDDAGDATKQMLEGADVPAAIITVFDGPHRRAQLTPQGDYLVASFDILLYLVGVTEDSGLDNTSLRALMSDLEKQVAQFVIAEGGNTATWNAIEYGSAATNDQTKTLAEILFAARVIPLRITSYR